MFTELIVIVGIDLGNTIWITYFSFHISGYFSFWLYSVHQILKKVVRLVFFILLLAVFCYSECRMSLNELSNGRMLSRLTDVHVWGCGVSAWCMGVWVSQFNPSCVFATKK